MLLHNKILFVLIIPMMAVALLAQAVFDGNGRRFSKVAGKTSKPKIVVHQLEIVAGTGTLALNKVFGRDKNNVSASADSNMVVSVTGILESPTSTVYYYSVYKSKKGDTLIVKSSGGSADTSRVNLQIVLK